MLQTFQLGFERNENPVFKEINFILQPGAVLEIVGANGAGKTTLLRVLCGLLQPSHGKIEWQGSPITDIWPQYMADIAYCGHQPALKLGLTVLENLRLFVTLSKNASCAFSHMINVVHRVGLNGYENTLTEKLSAGQRRRAVLARLLLANAKLWFLDEPLTALDRIGVKLMENILVEHVNNGGMVVLTSHQPVALGTVKQKILQL